MIREFDVVVVGAGPIGGYLSRRFNEHGNSPHSHDRGT